jgi:hypothetical protein
MKWNENFLVFDLLFESELFVWRHCRQSDGRANAANHDVVGLEIELLLIPENWKISLITHPLKQNDVVTLEIELLLTPENWRRLKRPVCIQDANIFKIET